MLNTCCWSSSRLRARSISRKSAWRRGKSRASGYVAQNQHPDLQPCSTQMLIYPPRQAMLEKGRRRRMSIENVVAARRVSVFGDTALGMQEAAQAGLAHPLDGPRKHEVQLLPGGYPPPPERHAQVGLLAPPPVEADAGVQGENNGRGSSLEESSLSWGDDLSDDEGGIRQI